MFFIFLFLSISSLCLSNEKDYFNENKDLKVAFNVNYPLSNSISDFNNISSDLFDKNAMFEIIAPRISIFKSQNNEKLLSCGSITLFKWGYPLNDEKRVLSRRIISSLYLLFKKYKNNVSYGVEGSKKGNIFFQFVSDGLIKGSENDEIKVEEVVCWGAQAFINKTYTFSYFSFCPKLSIGLNKGEEMKKGKNSNHFIPTIDLTFPTNSSFQWANFNTEIYGHFRLTKIFPGILYLREEIIGYRGYGYTLESKINVEALYSYNNIEWKSRIKGSICGDIISHPFAPNPLPIRGSLNLRTTLSYSFDKFGILIIPELTLAYWLEKDFNYGDNNSLLFTSFAVNFEI